MTRSEATDKQKGAIFAMAKKVDGTGPSGYIAAKLGKAMGLGMRARSGAGKLGAYVDGLSKHEASEVIDNLKRSLGG